MSERKKVEYDTFNPNSFPFSRDRRQNRDKGHLLAKVVAKYDHDHSLNYPHVKPKKNIPWSQEKLYGISGWFSSWYTMKDIEIATCFGGYFKASEDGEIEGEIIDPLGPSVIEGILTPTNLHFIKLYTNAGRPPISYDLENMGDFWKGKFILHKSQDCKTGDVECTINLMHANAFGMVGRSEVDWAAVRDRWGLFPHDKGTILDPDVVEESLKQADALRKNFDEDDSELPF